MRSLATLPPLLALRGLRGALFFAVTQAILTTVPFDKNVVLAGRVFVLAVASHLLFLAVLRTLLKPAGLISRSLSLKEATGAYLTVWINRIVATGIYGVFGLEGALSLGMPKATYVFLQHLVFAALWLLLVAFVLQNRTAFSHTLLERAKDSTNRPFWSLLAAVWHLIAIAFVTAGLLILLSNGDKGFPLLAEITAFMAGIMIVWRLGWLAVDTAGHHAFSISRDMTDRYPSLEKSANRYVPHLLGIARILISVGAIGALLEVWGLPLSKFLVSENGQALIRALATILIVGGGAIILGEVISLFVERRLHVLESEGRLSGRERTLLPLVRNAVVILIGVFAVFVILSEIGIDITPLIAGASIIGLAIGFGAQSLVKDVISGVFLLIEDTLNVGDFVEVGGKYGTVEALSIRTLKLRDVAGDMHTIPFGTVEVITNMTKGYAYTLVDVGIAYREDAEEVMKILGEIGNEMVADEALKDAFTGPFEVVGLQDLADSSVNIRTRVKTKPGMQWAMRREFLRRVKRRFDAEGIEIPFPHQTLYFGEAKDGSAPPAFVRVQQERVKQQATKEGVPGAAAKEYYQTSNPELSDSEAARTAERSAQAEEKRRAAEEHEKAIQESHKIEQELGISEEPEEPRRDKKPD